MTRDGGENLIRALVGRYRSSSAPRLILDYDGTLVDLRDDPADAVPDREILEVLSALSRRDGARLIVVSGRIRATLHEWLGPLPIDLVAEHGFFVRLGGAGWTEALPEKESWRSEVRDLLDRFAAETPGSFVERKAHALAWHDRPVEPSLAERRRAELLAALAGCRTREEFDVLPGNRVVEVRSLGATKGSATIGWLAANPGDLVLAIGDDATDEELFRALPEQAATIHVGPGSTCARWRLDGPREVRRLLVGMADAAALAA